MTKNSSSHSNSGALRLTKLNAAIEEADEAFVSLKSLKASKTYSTITSGSTEVIKNGQRKSHNTSKTQKSSDKIKVEPDIKGKAIPNLQTIQNMNIKSRKSAKAAAEPKVEVVVLMKALKKANHSLSEK